MNSKLDNYKHIYPELFLYDAINDTIKKYRNNKLDFNSRYRAVVVKYADSGDGNEKTGLSDSSPNKDNDYKIVYPRGCVQARVLGLDDAINSGQSKGDGKNYKIPDVFLRIFRPNSEKNEKLHSGDLIWVTFEDSNFTRGIWLGKIEKEKDQEENFGKIYERSSEYDIKGSNLSKKYVVDTNEKFSGITEETVIMQWPVDENTWGKNIVSDFGEIRKDGKVHGGIDISVKATVGATVSAAYDGIVKSVFIASDTESYIIEIEHGLISGYKRSIDPSTGLETGDPEPIYSKKWITKYVHLQNPRVQVGQQVQQGATIAQICPKDEKSTGPHLHFSIAIPKGPKSDEYVFVDPTDNKIAIVEI